MSITADELRHRIRNAIEVLAAGQTFKVGELNFAVNGNRFFVTGWSRAVDLKNITRQSAEDELKEVKELFDRMTQASSELQEFLRGRQIEYTLIYDYGMGGIEICSEMDGKLKWNDIIQK